MTLQQRDIILFQEKKYALNRDILKPFFELNPEKRPVHGIKTTALRRGYFSCFTVMADELFVQDICIHKLVDTEKREIVEASVVQEVLEDYRFCWWFNGTLILFSLNTDSTYLRMEVKDGKIIDKGTISQKEFLDSGIRAYDYF